MPNPLAPGVYIEEVPFASHSILGGPTSVVGFVAVTGRGPLLGPLTSFADFHRVAPPNLGVNLPLAVAGFFFNGGQVCFISQIAPGDPLDSGLAALDQQTISIVCCPDDPTIPNSAAILAAHCEKRKDRICILQSPQPVLPATQQPPVRSSYAVYYYPWITVPALTGTAPVTVPPGGHIAGVYARTDAQRGVWIVPANVSLIGLTALSQNLTPAESAALNSVGIDTILSVPAQGIVVSGNRTTSQDPNYQFISVRRLMIFLEQSIAQGTQWAVFEPNGPALWVAVASSIRDFLTTIWKSGAFKGPTQQDAFFVRCDDTTMTQNDIDNGRLVLVVGVAPLQPAEFVLLQVTIQTPAPELGPDIYVGPTHGQS
jgi:uncharacterized protein